MLIAVVVLFGSLIFLNSVIRASNLPDFDSWVLIHREKKDFGPDGIDDVIIKFASDKRNLEESSTSALLFYFQPFDSKRIDMAIVLHFIRTNEPGKNTILSVRIYFYVSGKNVGEKTFHRPKNIREAIKAPMFEENSLFGQRWFKEWRKFGLTDEEIHQQLPKWGWLPE